MNRHQLPKRTNAPQRANAIRPYMRLLGFGLIGLGTLRSLPYLAPIRPTDLPQASPTIDFRDRHNLPLGTLLGQAPNQPISQTSPVPLDRVSPHFIQAILAAEDRRFYERGPIDLLAIGRAIHDGIQAKQIVSGASTVAMQLGQMVAPTPRTPIGKLQNIWVTWRLDAGLSRREILEAYVNRLPMGSNIYGIEAAARVYFGVSAADLSPAQASLLAGLPNSPTEFDPYRHWTRLKQRQRYVLDRLIATHQLSPNQADRIHRTPLTLQPRQQGILAAPHFLFWTRHQLATPPTPLLPYSPTPPSQHRTTLDLPLQQFIQAQTQQTVQTLANHNVHQAAAIVLDNASGDILAYVGSTNYWNPTTSGQTDGVQALRQPGSTLKPFLYQLALDRQQLTPNQILADIPTYYAIPGAKLYNPQDYSETFQGPVRVRIALANSLNIPAVRTLETIGVAPFLDRLHQLGFKHLTHKPEYYGLGLSLGSGEVSLWELAQAYRNLAIAGQNGDTTAQLIGNMLADRQARAKSFGVDSVLSLPFDAAVKTGTSSDFRDTWTIGFTRNYTVATWVGNFDGSPMRQISGVAGAAPLWSKIMVRLHGQTEPAPLPKPNLPLKPICAISGHKPSPACPIVVEEYLTPNAIAQYNQPDPIYPANQRPGDPPNLPKEYNEWLDRQPQPTSGLRILSPRNGDYFIMTEGSQLQFKLAQDLAGIHNKNPIDGWLNNRKLPTGQFPQSWPLKPGTWTLRVRRGNQQDQVTFQVGLADRSTGGRSRGFSINHP